MILPRSIKVKSLEIKANEPLVKTPSVHDIEQVSEEEEKENENLASQRSIVLVIEDELLPLSSEKVEE